MDNLHPSFSLIPGRVAEPDPEKKGRYTLDGGTTQCRAQAHKHKHTSYRQFTYNKCIWGIGGNLSTLMKTQQAQGEHATPHSQVKIRGKIHSEVKGEYKQITPPP